MLDAVAAAIDRDHKRRDSEKAVTDTGALFDRLSPREREIMTLVTSGADE